MNFFLALTASLALPAAAIEPGKSQSLTSPGQVPEGLSAADWSSIRSSFAVNLTSQQAYLKPSNTGGYDSFGFSVAVSGDTVVVGAVSEDSSGSGVNSSPNEGLSNSGAAYVFTRSGGVWSQQAFLKASSPGANDYFGNTVAISGDTIVVGSPYEDSSVSGVNSLPNEIAPNAGAAYVFTRSGVTWSQQAYLKASSPGANDSFATAVAVSGDTIVIGTPTEDSDAVGVNNNQTNNLALDSGAVYVFSRSGSTWSQQAYLKASNTGAYDYFGYAVAISGETVVVGAFNEDSSTTGGNSTPNETARDSGAAYVFTRSGVIWSQQTYLKAGNSGADDAFGGSVAISGDTLVVGAQGEDSSSTGVDSNPDEAAVAAGAAYVFTRSGTSWSQQAYLKASHTRAEDRFGSAVAISGETIAVGVPAEDSSTTGVNSNPNQAAGSAGAAYLFTRSGIRWSQQAYLKSSNTGVADQFGYSLAISGSTVISGAHLEDSITTGIDSTPNDAGTANDSGAAYIFVIPEVVPPVVVPPVVVKFLVTVKLSQAKVGKVTGSGSFATGSKVTLKATPKRGHSFSGWYEKKKLISKKKVLVIKTLTANRSLVAKFK